MKKLKVLAVVLLIITTITTLSGCVVRLPIPEIKEGRFDFSVTYEINGEIKTCSGVYVCEYDGVLTTFLGSSIKWKGYVENSEEDVKIHTNEDGDIYVNFGFFPDYFMGDPNAIYYETPSPSLFMIYNDSNEETLHITGEEEDILQYGVRLISYDYADPIENTFKEKLSFSRFEPTIN